MTDEPGPAPIAQDRSSPEEAGCLEKLSSADVSAAATVLANAFRKYPIWTFIQPRDEKRRALLRWVLKRYLRGLLAKSGRKQGHAFAVRQSTAGDLAGIVLLWRPRSAGAGSLELPPWQVVRQGLLSLPFLFGAGVTHRLLQVDAGEERQKKALRATLGAYWYLDYLAVDTTLQSKGLGTRALLQAMKLAQAERDCPVLVNTCSEAARAFYMRNGFSEVGEPVVIGKQQHWWMVFPAQCPDVPVR